MLVLSAENYVYQFEPGMKGVAEARPGEKVIFETKDCFAGQVESENTSCAAIDSDHVNPATGPLSVAGAEKGDLLGVSIENIELASRAFSVVIPGKGALHDKVDEPLIRAVEIDNVRRTGTFKNISLPLKPMIGVIGVATESDSIPTGTPGKHGGNMDTRDITSGATLWLPVFQRGAMLALGDCHALMGDGEIGCSGAEVEARVTVSVDILKGSAFSWPLLVTAEEMMVIVSAETIDQAAATASDVMVALAAKTLDLDLKDALILCSLTMDLRISQIVDPLKTVRAVLPLNILPWERVKSALKCADVV
ncbi:MAG: acetamidase/formamidase family protein [Synergistaceae bacterium]|jgi:amidase|nr:acetamidase/formamidase family protein [Synergistaceae bacterium]